MSTVTRPSAFQPRLDHARHGADLDAVLVGQAAVADEAHEAARAVAALLHLAAVGVVDHVFEVDARRRRGPHRQDLVGADAEVAVRQLPVLRFAQMEQAAGFVEHDEVVAGALHLGEAHLHAGLAPAQLVQRPVDEGHAVLAPEALAVQHEDRAPKMPCSTASRVYFAYSACTASLRSSFCKAAPS
jgi:hypothetical protein